MRNVFAPCSTRWPTLRSTRSASRCGQPSRQRETRPTSCVVDQPWAAFGGCLPCFSEQPPVHCIFIGTSPQRTYDAVPHAAAFVRTKSRFWASK